MTRHVLIRMSIAFAAVAFMGAGAWLTIAVLHKPEAAPAVKQGPRLDAGSPTAAKPQTPLTPFAVQQPARTTPAITAAPKDVLAMLKEFDSLFASPPDGQNSGDLLARQRRAKQELVEQLANLGSGGARSIADAFKQTDVLRDRQILAQALGKIQDTEAVQVLKELLLNQTGFYERKELVVALAHRPEPAAIEPLSGLLVSDQPGVLQFSAVQGLSGRSDALPVLAATIETGADKVVSLEAIRSVGLIHNDAAKNELIGLAEKASLEPLIRQTAIQELRRSFGTDAQDVLQTLSNDPEPVIRDTASQALAMLHR